MKTEEKIICNCCKKVIQNEDFYSRTEYLHVEKEWGYFSGKDLKVHSFNLCEACYDRLLEEFEIPVTVEDKEVVLD